MPLGEYSYKEMTQTGRGFCFVFKLIKQMAEDHFIMNQSEGYVGGTEKVSSSEDIPIYNNSWAMQMSRSDMKVLKRVSQKDG